MAQSLSEKLKIKAGDIILPVNAPPHFLSHLGKLPPGAAIDPAARTFNQVHWFVTSKAQVDKETPKVYPKIKGDIICWIYFPKGSSKLQTDLSRDKGWDALMKHSDSLTWLSLVSFDDTWSAFAFRQKSGKDAAKAAKPKEERAILQYADPVAKTVRIPGELAAAFKKHKAEEKFFQQLAYSHRKEYVEWIVTAKQDATKAKRVEGTIEMLQKKWKNRLGQV